MSSGNSASFTAMRRLRDVLSNKSLVESAFGQVINDFVRKVDDALVQNPDDKSFDREYRQIRWRVEGAPGYNRSLAPQNKETKLKNRYCDVIPLEKTRVRLPNPTNVEFGDYINANFIENEYIACCAPVPQAMGDFWTMIWHFNVHVILMLTNFVEKDCLKADLYWEPKGKIMKFSGLLVQLVGEEESSRSTSTDGFLKRTFKIWLDGSKEKFRLVQQLQLISWPDHGVLKDFRVIAPLLEAVNNHHYTAQLSSKVQDSRIVVHCSAGIGRSGTFIAIDMILKGIVQSLEIEDEAERLLSLKKALNIQEIVLRIRSQRPGMVQTLEQYKMIYNYVAAVLSNRQPW